MSLSLSNGAESDGRQGSARQLEYFVTTVGAARLRRSKWSGAPRACVVCPSLVQRRRCSTAAGRRRAPFPNHVPGAASVWADLSTATTSEVGGFQSLPISCGACMGPPPPPPRRFSSSKYRISDCERSLMNALQCVAQFPVSMVRYRPAHSVRLFRLSSDTYVTG